MSIFITSDTYFNDNNIIDYDERNFDSVIEMNEKIIENWNKVVGEDDIVYHLGNFGTGRLENLIHIFKYLKGRTLIVRGNNDVSFNDLLEIGFSGVADELTLNYDGIIYVLTHKPDFCHKNVWGVVNIHGHIPSADKFYENFINVNCSAWDYTPIKLENLIFEYKTNKRRKK